ncbi:MAG: histidinol dehydrogenase [Promethearchaeota archaeon]
MNRFKGTDDMNIRTINYGENKLEEIRSIIIDEVKIKRVRVEVEAIIEDVKKRGDAALVDFARKFDGVDLSSSGLKVSAAEIEDARKQTDPGLIQALIKAKDNIEKYHARQMLESWTIETMPGVHVTFYPTPLSSVGIYIPGGRALYPSTVLMCAIPAKVAGVDKVAMITPPGPDGNVPAIVLTAASVAGVDEIYISGGAQAIAAFAFGTETVPAVDKIVGPGNIYVSIAKQLLQDRVLIDSPAGPSEVLIVAGKGANLKYVALDMCAQAEHDPSAVSITIVRDESQAQELENELNRLIPSLKRQETISRSLAMNGLIIIMGDQDDNDGFTNQVARVINYIAPEHLELMLDGGLIQELMPKIRNAGAVFTGEFSPVSVGDYASGANHVLPTSGAARRYSMLSTLDFIKTMSITNVTTDGLRVIAPIVSKIARVEGLDAHARSVEERIKDLDNERRDGFDHD